MEWKKGDYLISDDQALIDFDFVIRSLKTTYWAEDRTVDTIWGSIANSVFLSLLHKGKPIGFARIVGDGHSFAWIADVFIDPTWRGKGLGLWLMDCTMQHPAAQVLTVVLATRDAHGLYEKFGFQRREFMFVRPLE